MVVHHSICDSLSYYHKDNFYNANWGSEKKDLKFLSRIEIIIKNNVFDTKYIKMYPKARSLIAGIVNSKKPDPKIVKDIDIVFYEWIAPDSLNYEEQFKSLKNLPEKTHFLSSESCLLKDS